ncbi:cAMP-binding domain of CRP or a regulatory subunit of cAMP-dependent protein kinases [Tenacibaculum sp. MAR_2009_124]|uniref:Crp/Fnr family transcriptional regulator n=1 Tax=Tenacibaculum sp. MAR_2009_124 TaxID=1250059 RepID=UPI000897C21D|nr:Crp/Fnr family transcriptional regulator [Tenacibaculum sp. MAR_2009_124]SED14720.1 cAMP-binding domain of CRP or a regulatory subunit of cAMP-dependent protein kinases [Tenacibaculum sp. MAR_2009_124]
MRNYLASFNILNEKDISEFSKLTTPKKLKKGDYFIEAGNMCNEVAFINRGMLRSFYISSTGEDVTYCFFWERNFVTAYSSFITQTKTTESIQALTDVEILSISREDLLNLQESNINWLKFMKTLAEQEYINLENRVFLLQRESAEMRYKHMLKNHPEYIQTIPLNYLASYLGITQRHLSRIRKDSLME